MKTELQPCFMPRYLIVKLLCLIIISAPDWSEAQPIYGASSLAMGQTGVANPASGWSVSVNPALMSTQERLLSFYAFRYAGFTELTDSALSLTFPAVRGAGGIELFSYGFELFRESRFSAAYKVEFRSVHLGLSATYVHIRQGGGYGSAGAVGFSGGVAFEPAENIILGMRATNLNQPVFNRSDEELPRDIAIGFSYRSGPVLTTLDLVKDIRFPLSVRAGIDLELAESFHIRAGSATNPSVWSAGIGYITGRVRTAVAVQQHYALGLSPGFDIAIKL